MSLYLRIFGSVLILLSAMLAARGYSRYCERRLSTVNGFVAFLEHIRGEITRTLATPEGFARNFVSAELSECGFLGSVAEGKSLAAAFEQALPNITLGGEARRLLSEYFQGFGRDYMDGERVRTESYAEKLSRLADSDKEALPKNDKTCRVLLLSGALGLIILII